MRFDSPLSQASIVAKSSFFCSMRSARRNMSVPRSEAERSFQEGSLSALWAALTALSTSSGPAAWTVAIVFSVL